MKRFWRQIVRIFTGRVSASGGSLSLQKEGGWRKLARKYLPWILLVLLAIFLVHSLPSVFRILRDFAAPRPFVISSERIGQRIIVEGETVGCFVQVNERIAVFVDCLTFSQKAGNLVRQNPVQSLLVALLIFVAGYTVGMHRPHEKFLKKNVR